MWTPPIVRAATPRAHTRVVAASDSDPLASRAADFHDVQSAIDDLGSNGGSVLLLDGNHGGGPLSIPDNVALYGCGVGITTWKLDDGEDAHAIENADTTNGNSNISFWGITFDYNGANQSADRHGMRFQRVNGLRMVACELKNAYHHNIVSVTPTAGNNNDWYLSLVYSHDAGVGDSIEGDCFRINDGFPGSTGDGGSMGDNPPAVLLGCHGETASHHVYHIGYGVKAIGCHGEGCTDSSGATYYLSGGGALVECTGANSTGAQVQIDGGGGRVTGGEFDGSGTNVDVIRITGSGADAYVGGGARILNADRHGLHATGRVTIGELFIDGSGTHGILLNTSNCALSSGGVSQNNGAAGIRIEGSSNTVSGWRCTSNTDLGIREAGSGDNNVIINNSVTGNTGGGLAIVGSNTKVHLNNGSDLIQIPDVPTSDPSVAGQVWSNSGVLTVSSGS